MSDSRNDKKFRFYLFNYYFPWNVTFLFVTLFDALSFEANILMIASIIKDLKLFMSKILPRLLPHDADRKIKHQQSFTTTAEVY